MTQPAKPLPTGPSGSRTPPAGAAGHVGGSAGVAQKDAPGAPAAEPTAAPPRPSRPQCGAVRRDGGRCRYWPGQGTPHVGTGRCHLHGGNDPHQVMLAVWQAISADPQRCELPRANSVSYAASAVADSLVRDTLHQVAEILRGEHHDAETTA